MKQLLWENLVLSQVGTTHRKALGKKGPEESKDGEVNSDRIHAIATRRPPKPGKPTPTPFLLLIFRDLDCLDGSVISI